MDKNLIKEEDIIFITTTLYTKWLSYQSNIIKKLFPNSKHILIDGRDNWPNSWFYWINEVKKCDEKYYIHIDEDFFIESKEELLKAVSKLDEENIDLLGCADGYHHYRGANPVAMNTLFMIGRVKDIKSINIDINSLRFNLTSYDGHSYSWENNFGIRYKEEYSSDFNYPHRIMENGANFKNEHEPYYLFFWLMKNIGVRFGYLYPHFDDRFKSTNPRISEYSNDIGIHMWFVRESNSSTDIHGMRNCDRYKKVEEYINGNNSFNI